MTKVEEFKRRTIQNAARILREQKDTFLRFSLSNGKTLRIYIFCKSFERKKGPRLLYYYLRTVQLVLHGSILDYSIAKN
jgi:hypothetical protein